VEFFLGVGERGQRAVLACFDAFVEKAFENVFGVGEGFVKSCPAVPVEVVGLHQLSDG
jgi:hypothetical protein